MLKRLLALAAVMMLLCPCCLGEEEEEDIRTRWLFPEEFSLELEQDSGSELVELFRFFPDGGASGMRELIFKYHTFQKKYIISPLTGRIFAEETEE